MLQLKMRSKAEMLSRPDSDTVDCEAMGVLASVYMYRGLKTRRLKVSQGQAYCYRAS